MHEPMHHTPIEAPYSPLQHMPWLLAPWQQLVEAKQAQRFHHAFLFAGPVGIGKQHIQQELAASLVCDQQADDTLHIACGECKSCHLMKAGSHPDVRYLGDGKSAIGVDDVRKATDFVQGKPQLGGNKVLLISAAHLMSESAANALLKTLEEPTTRAFLLLTTIQLQLLLPTIISRCSVVNLRPLSVAQALPWLTEKHPHISDMQRLFRLSSGGPLMVSEWIDTDMHTELLAGFQQIADWLAQKASLVDTVNMLASEDNIVGLLQAQLIDWFKQHDEMDIEQQQRVMQVLNQYTQDRQRISGVNKKTLLLRLFASLANILFDTSPPPIKSQIR